MGKDDRAINILNGGNDSEIEKVKHKRERKFYVPEGIGVGMYNFLIAFTDDMDVLTFVKRSKLYDLYVEFSQAVKSDVANSHLFYGYMSYLKVPVTRRKDGFFYAMRAGITHSSSVAKGCFIKVWED